MVGLGSACNCRLAAPARKGGLELSLARRSSSKGAASCVWRCRWTAPAQKRELKVSSVRDASAVCHAGVRRVLQTRAGHLGCPRYLMRGPCRAGVRRVVQARARHLRGDLRRRGQRQRDPVGGAGGAALRPLPHGQDRPDVPVEGAPWALLTQIGLGRRVGMWCNYRGTPMLLLFICLTLQRTLSVRPSLCLQCAAQPFTGRLRLPRQHPAMHVPSHPSCRALAAPAIGPRPCGCAGGRHEGAREARGERDPAQPVHRGRVCGHDDGDGGGAARPRAPLLRDLQRIHHRGVPSLRSPRALVAMQHGAFIFVSLSYLYLFLFFV